MKVPPTSFPEGLLPPTPPHPQLTTTRVRLSASIPEPSVPGPAGLGGGPNCPFPQGAQVTSRVATCANCLGIFSSEMWQGLHPRHSPPPTGGSQS